MHPSPRQLVDPHAHPHWLRQFARLGYAAIGLVYTLVGVLALLSLFGAGGRVTGAMGAPKALLQQPYGRILLAVVVVGLAVYVVWRFVQAVRDVDDRGVGAVGVTRRLGLALSGAFYALVAAVAAERLFANLQGVPDSQQTLAAHLMRTTWGTVLVGLLGVCVVVAGAFQFRGAWQAGYMHRLRDEAHGGVTGPMLTTMGRFGLAARGVVFALIGGFLITAAWRNDPAATRGLSGALRTLRDQTYGQVLFGVVAAGLLAFGLTMLLKARYRQVPTSDESSDERSDGEADDRSPEAGAPPDGAAGDAGERGDGEAERGAAERGAAERGAAGRGAAGRGAAGDDEMRDARTSVRGA